MINGRDLILSINGTAVAASKGCSLKVNQNYIKSCSPTDGRTKRKIPTDYDWSVSTDCLVADTAYADSIIDLLTQGTEVTLRWYDTQLHQKRKGQAIIASIDENAPMNGLSTLSISFEGSGSLDKITEWQTITMPTTGATVYAGKYTYCPSSNATLIQNGDPEQKKISAKTITLTSIGTLKVYARNGACVNILQKTQAETAAIIADNYGGANINPISVLHTHSSSATGLTKTALVQPGTYTIITNLENVTAEDVTISVQAMS